MRRAATLLGLLVAFPAACHPTDALFCDEATACPSGQFCDLIGVFQDVRNTCVATPGDVCKESADCSAAGNPICGGVERVGVRGDTIEIPQCRACTDGAIGDGECAARGDDNAFCTGGSCVECRASTDCTADPERPHCDSSGSCAGCVENSECPSDVCDTDTSTCVDAAAVVYLHAGVGNDSNSCGTIASPCRSISGAMGGLAKVTGARNILRLRGAVSFLESVAITGQEVTITGPGTINPPDNVPGIDVRSGSTVTLRDIRVTDARLAAGNGVQCASANLTIERATIDANDGIGVLSSACALSIVRSTIQLNRNGGIAITGSPFTVENNFIVGNGTLGTSAVGAIRVDPASTQDSFFLNTVTNNSAQSIGGVNCASALSIDNSIIWNNSGMGLGMLCTASFSDIQQVVAGPGNISVDPQFVDSIGGNFRLRATSPCVDAADPDMPVDVDFDGDLRPVGLGPDIGADEVSP